VSALPRKGAPAPTDADDRFDDSRRSRRTLASNGSRSSGARVSSERHGRRLGRSLLAPTEGAARWRSWRYLADQRLCTRWHTLGRVHCRVSSEPRPLSTANLCLSGSAIYWPSFEPLVAPPDRGLALESRCTSARSARQRTSQWQLAPPPALKKLRAWVSSNS
jgi:hypothetical protein